jgi:hypothetical protein
VRTADFCPPRPAILGSSRERIQRLSTPDSGVLTRLWRRNTGRVGGVLTKRGTHDRQAPLHGGRPATKPHRVLVYMVHPYGDRKWQCKCQYGPLV